MAFTHSRGGTQSSNKRNFTGNARTTKQKRAAKGYKK